MPTELRLYEAFGKGHADGTEGALTRALDELDRLRAENERLRVAMEASNDESSFHVSKTMLVWQRRTEKAETDRDRFRDALRELLAAVAPITRASTPAGERYGAALDRARELLGEDMSDDDHDTDATPGEHFKWYGSRRDECLPCLCAHLATAQARVAFLEDLARRLVEELAHRPRWGDTEALLAEARRVLGES